MDGFFYAKIDAYEVQVYSDSPNERRSESVIYLTLIDQAYARAELHFVDRHDFDAPGNELVVSETSGAASFKAYFRLEKMPLILDVLRAGDNVWFTWDEARVAAIRAGREPMAGEEVHV